MIEIIIYGLIGFCLSLFSIWYFEIDVPKAVFWILFLLLLLIYLFGVTFIDPKFWSDYPEIFTNKFFIPFIIGIFIELAFESFEII